MPVITLLTDFGTADGYVAEMKGVLCTLAPEAVLIDLSHDLPPQDVDFARLTVARLWLRFPPGTIHLVVVDPDVGSPRPAIAVSSTERFLVGPDNGVLSPALIVPGAQTVQLSVPPTASPTFHGRDVFAPAAAALANGVPLASLGSPAPTPVIHRTPEPVREADGVLRGEVISIDRFGNVITNLVPTRAGRLEVAGRTVAVQRTYADVQPGEAVALVGSSGLLEVAVRNGNAAEALRVSRGASVRWRADPL